VAEGGLGVTRVNEGAFGCPLIGERRAGNCGVERAFTFFRRLRSLRSSHGRVCLATTFGHWGVVILFETIAIDADQCCNHHCDSARCTNLAISALSNVCLCSQIGCCIPRRAARRDDLYCFIVRNMLPDITCRDNNEPIAVNSLVHPDVRFREYPIDLVCYGISQRPGDRRARCKLALIPRLIRGFRLLADVT